MEIISYNCPNCDSSNFSIENDMYTCKVCLSKFGKKQLDSAMFVDLRQANNLRQMAKFEQARKIYEQILKNYPNENLTDVYWGMFLCEQNVIFEKDGKGENFPSFYRINSNSVEDTPSYTKAVMYAAKHNIEKVEIFNQLGEKIESARKMFLDISKSSAPYDIFICFKNSDENGNHTQDRQLAFDIYNKFSKDYNVFFSEASLKSIKSNYREYEPNIYYALYSAKVMLLICSKTEYIESQWVKNEWSRFLKISKQGEKQEKCIIPVFNNGFDPNSLPEDLWHCQGLRNNNQFMLDLKEQLEVIFDNKKIEKIESNKITEEDISKVKDYLSKISTSNSYYDVKIKKIEYYFKNLKYKDNTIIDIFNDSIEKITASEIKKISREENASKKIKEIKEIKNCFSSNIFKNQLLIPLDIENKLIEFKKLKVVKVKEHKIESKKNIIQFSIFTALILACIVGFVVGKIFDIKWLYSTSPVFATLCLVYYLMLLIFKKFTKTFLILGLEVLDIATFIGVMVNASAYNFAVNINAVIVIAIVFGLCSIFLPLLIFNFLDENSMTALIILILETLILGAMFMGFIYNIRLLWLISAVCSIPTLFIILMIKNIINGDSFGIYILIILETLVVATIAFGFIYEIKWLWTLGFALILPVLFFVLIFTTGEEFMIVLFVASLFIGAILFGIIFDIFWLRLVSFCVGILVVPSVVVMLD